MPDDKLTEFLVQLCSNTNGLLDNYLADRAAVVAAADLTEVAKQAFSELPDQNKLRAEIASTQVSGGGGPKTGKKAPSKARKAPSKSAKKAPAKGAKKAASNSAKKSAKKAAKGARKR